jgi:hypothetical protein
MSGKPVELHCQPVMQNVLGGRIGDILNINHVNIRNILSENYAKKKIDASGAEHFAQDP